MTPRICATRHTAVLRHTIYMIHQSIATCNGGNITISSDAIRESSECITDSTRTPSIIENIVGEIHLLTQTNHEILYSEADLEGSVRGVRTPPLKFAKHMLYNVN